MSKKIFCQKKYKGVTLLELLVVIAIISIVSVISFAMLNGVRESSQMENACNEVAALINKTRDYALTGKKFKKDIYGASYDKIPKMFVIVFKKDSKIVKIQDNETTPSILEEITLPAKVSVEKKCEFSVPNGDTKCDSKSKDEIKFKKGDETDSVKKVVIKGNNRFAVCE